MFNHTHFKFSILLFVFFLALAPMNGQSDNNFLIVDTIILKGNNKTKDRIVLRELDFKVGDTLNVSGMMKRFSLNEKRILNTRMFTLVGINIKHWNTELNTASVVISLEENWYIYPAPIFELADRNFNVWWNEQNRSFDRVNYGVRLDHINLTGNKDRLKLKLQFGYTRKYELKYDFPYINKKQTIGLSGNVFYSDNREIGYKTEFNKTIFQQFADERKLLRRFRTSLQLAYRPTLFSFHNFSLEFHRNQIDDEIASDFNPNYFLNGLTSLKFFVFNYNVKYDRRQFNLYPEGGYLLFGNIKKEGLGVLGEFNNLSIFGGFEKYQTITDYLVLSGKLKAKTNLIRNQLAFANNTGLGYGSDVIHGYELYVMDGTDYIYFKTAIRIKLFETNVNYGRVMPLKELRRQNIKTYLRLNYHTGYANEPSYKETNFLNNRILHGYGPALDIVLYNNFLFQLEYSFNHLNEHGLYLHNSISF